MFSQVSVILSTGGGLADTHPPPQGRYPPADTPPSGRHPPEEMATAADGTHSTGMHSFYRLKNNIPRRSDGSFHKKVLHAWK